MGDIATGNILPGGNESLTKVFPVARSMKPTEMGSKHSSKGRVNELFVAVVCKLRHQ